MYCLRRLILVALFSFLIRIGMNNIVDSVVYQNRRAQLARLMQEGIAIIPTASEKIRNRDSHFPFRYDSYFYYLTGFVEPDALLVIQGGTNSQSILFCRNKDPEKEIWDGFRYGPAGAKEAFHFDQTYSFEELDAVMPTLLANQITLSYPLAVSPHWDERILRWLNQVRAQARTGVKAPEVMRDVRAWLDEMRLFKSPEELRCMRRAAEISSAAHRRAMQFAPRARYEYEVEAELLYEFRRNGAQAPAYTPIVASGANACVLHYIENNAPLDKGQLLLIDAGCEFGGYAADITRTFPVSGKFSAAQKAVYEIVLSAQDAAIAMAKPGNDWEAPHRAALAVIVQGIKDLGLAQESMAEIIENETYKRFYMHRTGHWLGLDVHDVGQYKTEGDWRSLQAGMTLTVEPGFYIRPAPDIPQEFWHIGVRIEDDLLITETGNEVLSVAAPKTLTDVEATVQAGL